MIRWFLLFLMSDVIVIVIVIQVCFKAVVFNTKYKSRAIAGGGRWPRCADWLPNSSIEVLTAACSRVAWCHAGPSVRTSLPSCKRPTKCTSDIHNGIYSGRVDTCSMAQTDRTFIIVSSIPIMWRKARFLWSLDCDNIGRLGRGARCGCGVGHGRGRAMDIYDELLSWMYGLRRCIQMIHVL